MASKDTAAAAKAAAPSFLNYEASDRRESSRPLECKIDETLAVGKGATVRQFVATMGEDKLLIDIAP